MPKKHLRYSYQRESPLAGVNVVEKGTTNGTTTDFNGKYEIEVSGNYE